MSANKLHRCFLPQKNYIDILLSIQVIAHTASIECTVTKPMARLDARLGTRGITWINFHAFDAPLVRDVTPSEC